MYRISGMAQTNIERVLGVSIAQIKEMSYEEQEKLAQKKVKDTKIIFSKKKRKGRIGRGNPLLARRKIRTKEDLEKKEKKYIGV